MAETPKKGAPQKGTTTGTQQKPADTSAFPPFDQSTFVPQLIWLALTFGALYIMLSKYILPRITEVIEERQGTVSRDLAKAEALKHDTDKALATYEKALAEAKGKAGDIAKTTRDRLTAETDAEKVKAEADIAKSAAAAEARIAASKSKALASVNDIAGETVAAIVSKLTGANIKPDDAVKAVAALRK
jgi:F-type H+-transporting ATPase subunit b